MLTHKTYISDITSRGTPQLVFPITFTSTGNTGNAREAVNCLLTVLSTASLHLKNRQTDLIALKVNSDTGTLTLSHDKSGALTLS